MIFEDKVGVIHAHTSNILQLLNLFLLIIFKELSNEEIEENLKKGSESEYDAENF